MKLYIIRHAQSANNALMENQHLRVKDPSLTETGLQQAEHLAEWLSTATDIEEIVRHPADSPHRHDPHKHGITHLYCSAMHRSLQTARPLGQKLGITPEVWLEIHEHGGIFLEEDGVVTGYGGMTRQEILDEFPEYILPETLTERGWWKPEDGIEDISLCQARATRVAKALRARATQPNRAVSVARVARAAGVGDDGAEGEADEQPEEAIALISHGTFIDSLLKALLNNLPGGSYFHWHYNTAITRMDLLPSGTIIVRYINRVTHLPPELVT